MNAAPNLAVEEDDACKRRFAPLTGTPHLQQDLEKHQSRTSKGSLPAIDVKGKQIAHGLPSNANRERLYPAPASWRGGGRTQPQHQGPIGSVAVSHQRFTANPSPLAYGARRCNTSFV
jgi:hypothetical protein